MKKRLMTKITTFQLEVLVSVLLFSVFVLFHVSFSCSKEDARSVENLEVARMVDLDQQSSLFSFGYFISLCLFYKHIISVVKISGVV